MSFDCSRISFDPQPNYFGVVMQQGRVLHDADWNEWLAELGRRFQAGSLDVMGFAAVPSITPDGFLIEKTADGDLTIGHGRIYVDGLLAENHGGLPNQWDPRLAEQTGSKPLPFLSQPSLPFNEVTLPSPANVFNHPDLEGGPHLAYVEVWQRAVTHLQAPHLVEQAIGVDTTGRIQTVWQVRLLPDVGTITADTPDAEVPGWADLIRPSGARLSTAPATLPSLPDPCKAPTAGGYKGRENQLYRCEILQGGDRNHATFMWSRENATVAARVSEIQPGNRLVVESLGRDDEGLGFHAGDWIEVLDDWHELHGLAGPLRRIRPGDGVDHNTRSILLEDALPAGLFPVDGLGHTSPKRYTRIRRWDQSGPVRYADGTVFHNHEASASSSGIPVPPEDSWLALESGILVKLDLEPHGEFKAGDYWVFATRTADASIELLDRAPPLGIHRHYARLALVTFPGTPVDLRTLYPPLTTCGTCTFTVKPGQNWGEVFSRIPKGGDAELCFEVGDYPLAAPLLVKDKGHLKLTGAGAGSRILAAQNEQALVFLNCKTVLIEDLNAETGVAGSASKETGGLLGTLSFERCAGVTLSRVGLFCGAAVVRSAACLRVVNDGRFADLNHLRGTVDVQNCRFEVGSNQIGALVINGSRVLFRNNSIRCRDGRTDGQRIGTDQLRADPILRAEVRRSLVADIRSGEGEAEPYNPLINRRTLRLGERVVVNFRSHPGLEDIGFYQQLVEKFPPKGLETLAQATDYLQDAIDQVMLDPDLINGFRDVMEGLVKADVAALYQGITIGGEEAEEVRIQDNTFIGALQGVHIGQSRRSQPADVRLKSTTVIIEGNSIDSRITPAINREAYGIYVGNCDSLLVCGNRLRREEIQSTAHLSMDGVHVVGLLGPRVLVRHNEIAKYSVDVHLDPEQSDLKTHLWLVADNVASKLVIRNNRDNRVKVERNL